MASIVSHTASFDLDQPVERLFPLFSPEGETLWVPGWTYVNIMGSTDLHEDDVFLTTSHDHAAATAIWIVKQYDPVQYTVQFYKVEPEEKVGRVKVRCEPLGVGSTRVIVTYTYTGLSETGNRFIDGFTEAAYQAFIAEWRTLLVHHFERI